MGVWAKLTLLLELAVVYFKWKAADAKLKYKRYEHDVVEQSRAKVETMEDELESLRDIGDEPSTQLADRLRKQIRFEKAYFEHLSGFRLKVATGNDDTDS